ncbi:MAG: tetratricopeptide (TPR) repeat protein [bacterium]|jgi:tetratricopeptide (TPR) repeat protein
MNVPVHQFNKEQKHWYAYVIACAIIADQKVDDSEVSFLKHALHFLDEGEDRENLLTMVRAKDVPFPELPEGLNKETLATIFTELILLITANGKLDPSEVAFLKQAADQFSFKESYFAQVMDWCYAGLKWRLNRNILVQKCQLLNEEKVEKVQALDENHKSNSLLEEEVTCYICDSDVPTTYFRLKHKTQIIRPNIFGVPTYQGGTPDHDPVDYNRARLILCPYCHFASTDPNHFHRRGAEKPKLLESLEFTSDWMSGLQGREPIIEPHLDEFEKSNRAIAASIIGYKLGIKAYSRLVDFDDEFRTGGRQLVNLWVTLAQLQMEQGKRKEAETSLKQGKAQLMKIFSYLNEEESIKSAKMLVFLSLYFKDEKTASTYIEFLRRIKSGQKDQKISKAVWVLINASVNECADAWTDRKEYAREKLKGFFKK